MEVTFCVFLSSSRLKSFYNITILFLEANAINMLLSIVRHANLFIWSGLCCLNNAVTLQFYIFSCWLTNDDERREGWEWVCGLPNDK